MDYSGSNQPESGSSGSGSDDFKYQYKDQGGQGNTPPSSPPPPPPPPRAKSFNWLACCGISCGVIAVIIIILGVVSWKLAQGALESFQPMIDATEQVGQTDLATIKAQAISVTSQQLAGDPGSYTAGWLEIEGVIIPTPEGDSDYPGGNDGTIYFLVGNVLVVDYSNGSRVGLAGDTLRGWGKAVKFDVTSIPFFGTLFDQAMKSDPNVPDLSNLVLFMAKGVELAGSPPENDSSSPADTTDSSSGVSTEKDQDDGWL